VLLASTLGFVLNLVLIVLAVVLILLVLIQRGRGGGLVGALGGSGGSSPFGSRAGDTFTRLTLGLAIFWIFMNMVMIWVVQPSSKPGEPPSISEPETK
jgi:preprotein translocase subunit SecG